MNKSEIVENVANNIQMLFSWTDYILFVVMLILSMLIGVYFGFFKKQDTCDKYLLGGKQMGFFPVSISLIASHVSGITIMGLPSDVYYYGTAYMASILSAVIVGYVTITVFLPVFYKLEISNSFQYLQTRFDNRIRYITSFLFILKTVLYIPIVIYVPALAFSQVTGLSIHFITPAICFVCIFYTSVGGLKAVVWTDTLQFIMTIIAVATVFAVGVSYSGGLANIWTRSEEGGRLDFFNLDPSLTSRCTFWGVVIGLTGTWFAELGINQGCIQKFLSIPTFGEVKKSMYVFVLGVALTKTICGFMGLIMFTKYQFCDPFSANIIKRADQILPYYVTDITGHISGLPGLFIAGVFCTALSTMSASLNTMSGTMYQDFISPFMNEKTDEQRASNIMKCCAFVTGVICVLLVFVVEKLGGILHIAISISGVTAGPIVGLFTLGICFPWANSKGALVGSITGIVTILFTAFGAQYHKALGNIKYSKLPLSTLNCSGNLTSAELANLTYSATTDRTTYINNDEVFFLFKLSYMYYTVFSMLVVIIVGLIVSWLTGFEDLEKLNPDLIAPPMQFALPKLKRSAISNKEKENYKTVEHALKMINLK